MQSNHLIRARRKRKENDEDEQQSMQACSTNYRIACAPTANQVSPFPQKTKQIKAIDTMKMIKRGDGSLRASYFYAKRRGEINGLSKKLREEKDEGLRSREQSCAMVVFLLGARRGRERDREDVMTI